LDDEEEEAENAEQEEAYQWMKKFGDQDHKERKSLRKDERSADLMTVFTFEKAILIPTHRSLKMGGGVRCARPTMLFYTSASLKAVSQLNALTLPATLSAISPSTRSGVLNRVSPCMIAPYLMSAKQRTSCVYFCSLLFTTI
jgi:hypothetical protein